MSGESGAEQGPRAPGPIQGEHRPVLLGEILAAARIKPGDRWVDGTFGRGGHSRALLEAGAWVLGLDQDPTAEKAATLLKEGWPETFWWKQENFRNLKTCCEQHGWDSVQGILLDLGVSSPQLDSPERGFSFRHHGPLDMRMNQNQAVTAAHLINTCSEQDLAKMFYELGDEQASRPIARAIVSRRQQQLFQTTDDLAEVVAKTVPYRRASGIHPATKVFQALRMAVNEEREALSEVLPQAVSVLAPGGALAVISFHSGEDKKVKDFLRKHSDEWLDTPGYPNSLVNPLRLLNKPTRILPSEDETNLNPRSRSARLRIARKLNLPNQ